MSSKGNNVLYKGIPATRDAFVVIVKTEWNASLINKMEKGCKRILEENGASSKTIVVPGAFEIPYAIKLYAASAAGKKAAAFIALGAVVRGDTPHFDYVCKAVTDGIASLNLLLDVPVIFGVLTVDNEQQALDRIGGKHGHKGEEAAVAALKMIALKKKLDRGR